MQNRNSKGASIVICTYNRFLVGAALINALTEQVASFPFEIVIVDASDSIKFRLKIKRILTLNKAKCEISYIHTSQGGLSIQRNIGLLYSRYKAIGFIDDDMIPKGKHWLEKMAGPILGNVVEIVSGRIRARPDPLIIVDKRYSFLFSQFEPELGKNIIISDPLFVPVSGNLFFRKDCVEKSGGFRPNLGRSIRNGNLSGEESELLVYLKRINCKLLFKEDSLVNHYLTPERMNKIRVAKRLYWQGITDYLIFTYEPLFKNWWLSGWRSIADWLVNFPNQSLYLLYLHFVYLLSWFAGYFYRKLKTDSYDERIRPYALSPAMVFLNCDEWEHYA